MSINSKNNFVANLSEDNIHYRPQIQLDCRMIQVLVEELAFADFPLAIADVGVRLGFDRAWDIFADQCIQVGFEPDTEECDRLEAEYAIRKSQNLPREQYESIALWENIGTQTLYIPRHISATSCFPPNQEFYRRLPEQLPMEIVKTIEIKTTTLDDYSHQKNINFDVIKIDVQGGELPILKGGIHLLQNSIIAVVAEVEFVELYQGQPLFAEIDQFMRAQGFALFDLDIRRWRRKRLSAVFDGIRVGQTIYADALYLKDPVEYNNLPDDIDLKRVKLLKLASLAEYFSLPDYGMEILELMASLELINKKEADRLISLLDKNNIIGKRDRSFLNQRS